MTAIRSVVSDLVDRRLWPLAVLLVGAAIAIPVLLLKPAADKSAPAVAATPTPDVATPAVSLSGPVGGPVLGGVKNPFRQQHVPPKATSTTASATANQSSASGVATPSGGTSAGSGGGSSSGGSGGSGGHSSPASSGTLLQVRFGQADRSRKTYEVSPGSPLPSPTNPLLVYLGQDKTGKVGGFLVSSDAQPQGDGRCDPDRSICSTLYMKVGDTEFFDVTGPSGTVQYELEVLKVVKS
jgi:hypothetical protein